MNTQRVGIATLILWCWPDCFGNIYLNIHEWVTAFPAVCTYFPSSVTGLQKPGKVFPTLRGNHLIWFWKRQTHIAVSEFQSSVLLFTHFLNTFQEPGTALGTRRSEVNQLRFLFSSWKWILNGAVINMRVARILAGSGKCGEDNRTVQWDSVSRDGAPLRGPLWEQWEYDSFAKIWSRNIPGGGTACAKALRRKQAQGDKNIMNKEKVAPDEVGDTGEPTSPDKNADVIPRAMGLHGRVSEWENDQV